MRLRVSIILACLLVGGCAQQDGLTASNKPPATGIAAPLSEDEVKTRLSGKTFNWLRARDQASGLTTFAADGSMSWRRTDVKTGGTGKWWVKDGKLCQEYAPTPDWKGGLVCRTLTAVKTNLVTSPNAGGRVTFTEISG